MNARDATQILYTDLQKVARNVMKNRKGIGSHDDLLHITLEQVLKSDEDMPLDSWRWYCIRAITIQCNGASIFNNTFRAGFNIDPEKEHLIPDHASWLGSRMDNEVLDMAINMIPSHFDRLVFLEYVLEDFDYRKFAKESRIPLATLYDSVARSKAYLREIIKKR